MDSDPAPVWPPAPLGFPPARGVAAHSAAPPALSLNGDMLGGESGLLLAPGERLLLLSPPLVRPAKRFSGDPHGGPMPGSAFGMRGATLVVEQSPPPLLARQLPLPMPLLGPRTEPLVDEWAIPSAVAHFGGHPAQGHGARSQGGGEFVDTSAPGSFAHSGARDHFRATDARLDSGVPAVVQTATARSFDWKIGTQQQEPRTQSNQATWPDRGWNQQEQLHHAKKSHAVVPSAPMTSDGSTDRDRSLFLSPSWTPELHTSFAASMITPEFSSVAWGDDGGAMQRGMSSDSDAVTSMASISSFASKSSPKMQNGHSVLRGTLDTAQDGQTQVTTMLRVSPTQPEGALQTQWLTTSSRISSPIGLLSTQEKERQAEASLDMASRSTVDEELLQSLARPTQLNAVVRSPPGLQSAPTPSYSAKTTEPLAARLAPAKAVVVPGLALSKAPQYRRLCLADILNDTDSRDSIKPRKRSYKPRKHGAGQKQPSTRRSKAGALIVALERPGIVKKRLLPKPDNLPGTIRPTNQLSPASWRVGSTAMRVSLSTDTANHPSFQLLIPRTQPSIPPVLPQRQPRTGAEDHQSKLPGVTLTGETAAASSAPHRMRVKGRAKSSVQRAMTPLPRSASSSTPAAAFRVKARCPTALGEVSCRPEMATTKRRRRSEIGQTQRMILASQMMQEALRGVGVNDAASSALDAPQGCQSRELNAPGLLSDRLTTSEFSFRQLKNGSEERNGHSSVYSGVGTTPDSSTGLLGAAKLRLGAPAEATGHSPSPTTLKSAQVLGGGFGDAFDLGAVTAELPLTGANNTVVVFCKRDFMRYQAAKLWRKYQEQQRKQEWRPVRVEGKRTRFRNPKYDTLVRKAESRVPKARNDPPSGLGEAKRDVSTPSALSVDTNGDSLPQDAPTECTS